MTQVNVRYIVDDMDAAISFYTEVFGFEVDMHPAPSFAALGRGDLRLLLNTPSGPGGASQPMPDGRRPEPGGWNRFQLVVDDLDRAVDDLRRHGAPMRSDVIEGVAGRQVIVDDPSGNPVELFEPA
jgi:catechol 2,3-dioxygenase-like lactoylglutathione lyase family enzyme